MARFELGDRAAEQIAEGLRRLNALSEPAKFAMPRRHGRTVESSAVPVRNDSGEEIPAFGLMRITGTTTVDDEVIWTVAKPNATFQRFVLVNGETAIPASGSDDIYGTGYFCDRPFRALYDTSDGTPSYGESWGAGSGSWKLQKDHFGFMVLGDVDDDTTGEETVRVAQQPFSTLIGKPDSGISANSSGTISLYKPSDRTDTGLNVTAYTIVALTAAKWVTVEYVHGTYYAFKWEC